MKDEIKEILDGLNQITTENKKSKNPLICTLISFAVLYKLLDYITNLQEEVKSANESITWWSNRFNALQKENERLNAKIEAMSTLSKKDYKEIYECLRDFEDGEEHFKLPNTIQELEDYKSRIDKAIEYIKENSYFKDNVVKTMIFQDYSSGLLNILNGGDDNE